MELASFSRRASNFMRPASNFMGFASNFIRLASNSASAWSDKGVAAGGMKFPSERDWVAPPRLEEVTAVRPDC